MAYITESQLRSYAQNSIMESRSRSNFRAIRTNAEVSIFLSHSHKDNVLAEGFANYLGSLDISVYIDWKDTAMPKVPNRETAIRIKERIRKDSFFVLIATRNACESRWCPWELGIADDAKSRDKILILPVKDPDGNFYGNEYIQIYPRTTFPIEAVKVIGTGIQKLAVFQPESSHNGKHIDKYFKLHK